MVRVPLIGLGAIPPSADKGALDGVSVRGIVSSRVLSFTMLRTSTLVRALKATPLFVLLIAAAAAFALWLDMMRIQ